MEEESGRHSGEEGLGAARASTECTGLSRSRRKARVGLGGRRHRRPAPALPAEGLAGQKRGRGRGRGRREEAGGRWSRREMGAARAAGRSLGRGAGLGPRWCGGEGGAGRGCEGPWAGGREASRALRECGGAKLSRPGVGSDRAGLSVPASLWWSSCTPGPLLSTFARCHCLFSAFSLFLNGMLYFSTDSDSFYTVRKIV